MAKVIQYTIGMANGFFIIDQGIVAVDTGSELSVSAFRQVCAENGIHPKDIKLIVITHGHVDHFVNAGAMRAISGAPILCHRNAAPALRYGIYPDVHGRNELGHRLCAAVNPDENPCPYLPPMDPDLIFEGVFDLRPYGVDGKIIETPGHSLSDTSVILNDRQAFLGDLLLDDMQGGVTLAYFGFDKPEICNPVLFKSCDTLVDLADIFYVGHGGPYTRQQFVKALEEAKAEAAAAE